MAGAFAVLLGCGRVGYDPERRNTVDASMPTEWLITVCATGCDYSAIQPALDFAVSLTDTTGLPIAVEVRDGRTYGEEISVTEPAARVPLSVRAQRGQNPTLLGPAGTASVVAVQGPRVTVAGFVFRGASQRAIFVNAPGVTIHHNVFTADFDMWSPDQFYRGTGVLLIGEGTRDADLYNNTFYDCEEAVQILDAVAAGYSVRLRNNIFVQLTRDEPAVYEPILWFKPSVAHYDLDSEYNLFFYTGDECIAWDQTIGAIVTMAEWQAVGGDTRGLGLVDPLLANPAGLDFHLRSMGGRYDPGLGAWVTDAAHSPAIDQGDPAFPVGDEPPPNGSRINLGSFGGTAEASLSFP